MNAYQAGGNRFLFFSFLCNSTTTNLFGGYNGIRKKITEAEITQMCPMYYIITFVFSCIVSNSVTSTADINMQYLTHISRVIVELQMCE